MLEALARANFDRDVARINPRTIVACGWRIVDATYPVLDVILPHRVARPLRLRFICGDWDDLPPSIELLDESGTYLTDRPAGSGGQFHAGPHPNTGRPFICMRGCLEYHTHVSHLPDLWANHRGQPGMDLGGILFQLWQVWSRSTG